MPLLVNMQPAGEYLGEDYFRAGGLPAVMHELLQAGRLHGDALTINGKTVAENVAQAKSSNADVIRPYDKPLKAHAGFKVLRGNLFDSAIMKTSVISDEFRQRYLCNPKTRMRSRAAPSCSTGPEDYHHRIDDPALAIDEHTHPVHARRRADRLSGLGRSGEHAAAGGADQTGHDGARLHRRRPAIRHIGLAVDPQCLAGGGRRRRACAAQDRRSRAHRSQQGHRRYPDLAPRN